MPRHLKVISQISNATIENEKRTPLGRQICSDAHADAPDRWRETRPPTLITPPSRKPHRHPTPAYINLGAHRWSRISRHRIHWRSTRGQMSGAGSRDQSRSVEQDLEAHPRQQRRGTARGAQRGAGVRLGRKHGRCARPARAYLPMGHTDGPLGRGWPGLAEAADRGWRPPRA